MAIGDIFQTYVQVQSQQRQMRIGFAYEQVGGPDSNALPRLVNEAWEADVLTLFLDLLATNVFLQCMYTRKVAPAPGIPDTLNFTGQPGTRLGESNPNDSPFVIRNVTDALSSKANGRQFISGVSATDVLDGVLTAAFVAGSLAAYLTQATVIISPPSDLTTDFQPSVISRINDGVPLVPPVGNTITSATTDQFIKSQRRRRTGKTEIA